MNSREAALKVLIKLDKDSAYVNKALLDELTKGDFPDEDKGLVTELVMGCVKKRELLDFYVMQFSKTKIRKMSAAVRNILELGAYQIVFLSRIPDSAACNESVKLASKYAARSKGFVNGVLRSLARGKDSLRQPNRKDGDTEYLSVMYSYPVWMTELLINQYGFDECEKIYKAADLAYHPMIRANRLKAEIMTNGRVDNEKFAELLKSDGIDSEPDNEIEGCFNILGKLDISRSEIYKSGFYSLQNRSSQKAVLALDPMPGDIVIDVCAAPGGKATAIAEKMNNRGRVLAFDIYEHKVKIIMSAAKRLGIDIIEAREHDASCVIKELENIADRVLVDAPCSGLGVIHTKPDIKRYRKAEDIDELCKTQSGILAAARRYVKSGGILVYSTCTILRQENEDQVAAFLDRNKDFELICETKLMTHITGGSGFYIAKMKKRK